MAVGVLVLVPDQTLSKRDNTSRGQGGPKAITSPALSEAEAVEETLAKLALPWAKTPCVENPSLSDAAGCRIFAKLEYYQPSRSFKSRGIGNRIYQCVLAQQSISSNLKQPLSFYSCSAGNAGLAAATASTLLSQNSTVVVPSTTTLAMQAMISSAGAKVIVHGTCIGDADTLVRSLASTDPNGVYVSPYNHEDIWAGNSTVIDEMYEQMGSEAPDAIVCSVGGGGLLNGILLGLDRYGWNTTTVLAIETEGADSLAQSLSAGYVITMPKMTSIAKSLSVGEICEKTWELVKERNERGEGKIESIVLSDAEAAMACVRYTKEEGVVIEPACGVSIAGAYNGLFERMIPGFSKDSKVAVIVCGGSTVSLDDVTNYAATYAEKVTWSA